MPVAWVALDESDNDPVRFLAYFVAGVRRVRGDIGGATLKLPHAPQPPPTESVLAPLINEIASLSGEFALILDDYHVIEIEPIHDALTLLLGNLPPQMHLIIATRTEPPLPPARLRARGDLVEISTADLRFTEEEAGVFLDRTMGLDISPDDVAALQARTEGWAVGLQLAALSLQGDSSPSGAMAFSGENRLVVDYLMEEVFQRQTVGVQTFLLRTAVLRQLTAGLCDAVTDNSDSQLTLDSLERNNLFIVALDNSRQWYRYHYLFHDFLRSRLERTSAEAIPQLHRQASDWYLRNDSLRDAIHHALEGEAYDQASDLIERAAGTALIRGEVATLQKWLLALPDELIRSRPRLGLVNAAQQLFSAPPGDLEHRLQEIESALEADNKLSPGEADGLHGQIAAHRARIAFDKGEYADTIHLCTQSLSRLAEDDHFWRGVVTLTLATAYLFNNDPEGAKQAFEEAVSIGKVSANLLFSVRSQVLLARVFEAQGQLHQAAREYQQAAGVATDQQGNQLPIDNLARRRTCLKGCTRLLWSARLPAAA